MVSEADKYVAYSYQIAGFALMTPMGQLVLSLRYLKLVDLNLALFLYFFLTLFLFGLGILYLKKGLEIFEEGYD